MTTPSQHTVPHGLPLLSRGRHADGDGGSCLMEYVSVLAGRHFSDRPRCTHPLLAWAARRVNDAVSDVARPELATLAPDLIGTRIHRRGTRRAVRGAIYAELAAAGLAATPGDPDLCAVHELGLAHLAGCRWRRPVGAIDRNFVFQKTLEAVADVGAGPRDELLCTALAASVARSRQVLGLNDSSSSKQAAWRAATRVAMRS